MNNPPFASIFGAFALSTALFSAQAGVTLLQPPVREQISNLPASLTINDMMFVSDSVVIAVSAYTRHATPAHSSHFLRSTDCGSTWSIIYSDTTHHAEKITVSPTGKIFVFMSRDGKFGRILSSDDSGETWNPLCSLPQIDDKYLPQSLFCNSYDDTIMVAVFDSGAIMKTIDGGQNWNLEKLIDSIDYIQSAFTRGNTLAVLDGNQKMYVKNLSNGTIKKIADPHYAARDIYITTEGLILVYGIGALQYYKEEDDSWIKCGKPFSSVGYPKEMVFASESSGYLVGEARLLYKTNDGGRNWTAIENPGITDASNFNVITFNSKGKGIASDNNANWFLVYDDTEKSIPPVAKFGATPNSGTAPLLVSFSDSSIGEPTSWKWDLNGDGICDDSTENPVFEYVTAGSYSVTLIVSNNSGIDTLKLTDYIKVNNEFNIEGDTIITIGSGDTIDLKPLNMWNNQTYGQYIYTSDQMSVADTIYSLAIFKVNTGFEGSGKALNYLKCKIKMKNTANDTITITDASSSMGTRDTSGELCFEGTISVPEINGWVWIPLSKPFVRTNNQNISVLIQHATDQEDYNDDAKWRHTKTNANRAITGYDNDYGFVSSNILDIKFATSVKTVSPVKFGRNSNANMVNLRQFLNPNTNNVTFLLSLPTRQNVSLKVYNLQGKEICSINKHALRSGKHSILINRSKFTSGSYLYVLKTEQKIFKNRILFIQR